MELNIIIWTYIISVVICYTCIYSYVIGTTSGKIVNKKLEEFMLIWMIAEVIPYISFILNLFLR